MYLPQGNITLFITIARSQFQIWELLNLRRVKAGRLQWMETIATPIDFHEKKRKSLQEKVCIVNLPMKTLGDDITRQQSCSEIIFSSFTLSHLMGQLCSYELLHKI